MRPSAIIDTHAHIYDEAFADDLDSVIDRARAAGIVTILLPPTDLASLQHVTLMAANHPDLMRPMIGLHPEDIGDDPGATLNEMETLLANPHHPYVAIGEVGLDYHWRSDNAALQQYAFMRQVEWARQYDLPLMIHTRDAHADLVAAMHNAGGETLSGVFHCFTGTSAEAAQLLAFPHFMLGIGGAVTFRKSSVRDAIAAGDIPLERIVLETDAPYLTPVPHRGQRNEPAMLTHVVACLAQTYGVDTETICRVTTNNARTTFRLAE